MSILTLVGRIWKETTGYHMIPDLPQRSETNCKSPLKICRAAIPSHKMKGLSSNHQFAERKSEFHGRVSSAYNLQPSHDPYFPFKKTSCFQGFKDPMVSRPHVFTSNQPFGNRHRSPTHSPAKFLAWTPLAGVTTGSRGSPLTHQPW